MGRREKVGLVLAWTCIGLALVIDWSIKELDKL